MREQATAAWEERVRKALLRRAAEAAGKPYIPEAPRPRKTRADYRRYRQFVALLAAFDYSQVLAGAQAARRVRRLRSYLRRRARALLKRRRFHAARLRRPVPNGKWGAPVARYPAQFGLAGAVHKTTLLHPAPRGVSFVTKGARQVYRSHQRAAISAARNRHQWERPFDEHRGQL